MPHRVVVACDKFKGSLTGRQVLTAIEEGMRAAVPDLDVVGTLIADGGDGTLDAAESAGFTRVRLRAAGPLGAPRESSYVVRGRTAVVEMAEVCGLVHLPGGRRDALGATSRGLGEALAAALDAGAQEIVLGIGGSASTDGGAGMLQALGARLLDASGEPVGPGGGGLAALASVDLSGLHPALTQASITLASDVNNPLVGSSGAAAVFGPQKGASPQDVTALDEALTRFADLISAATGRDLRDRPGAGAAGGVGYAAMAVLDAHMRPGIEVILELTGFAALLDGTDRDQASLEHADLDEYDLGRADLDPANSERTHPDPANSERTHPDQADVDPTEPEPPDPEQPNSEQANSERTHLEPPAAERADLVVTGEGALDLQTLLGKAPAGVAQAAQAAGIPVIALCGTASLPPEDLARTGIRRIYQLVDLEPDTAVCMRDADRLLRELAGHAAWDFFADR